MEVLPNTSSHDKSDSNTPDIIEEGIFDSTDLVFRTSDIRLVRGLKGETFAEKQAKIQAQIDILESTLEESHKELTDVIDGYYSSKNEKEKEQFMTKWIECVKQIKHCQANIRNLTEKSQYLSL